MKSWSRVYYFERCLFTCSNSQPKQSIYFFVSAFHDFFSFPDQECQLKCCSRCKNGTFDSSSPSTASFDSAFGSWFAAFDFRPVFNARSNAVEVISKQSKLSPKRNEDNSVTKSLLDPPPQSLRLWLKITLFILKPSSYAAFSLILSKIIWDLYWYLLKDFWDLKVPFCRLELWF